MNRILRFAVFGLLALAMPAQAPARKPRPLKAVEAPPTVEVYPQTGHSGSVPALSFAPDGRTLATGSHDQSLKLWDVATGRELRTLVGHTLMVTTVAYAPDGRTVASGAFDDQIKLWDAQSGRLLRTLTGHTSLVTRVAFSPDGRTLASSSGDNTVKLWDVVSGRNLRTLRGHTETVESVAFSPDGRTLVSGSKDKTIKLWNLATGRLLNTFGGHTDGVDVVAFSPDGRTLMSASRDHSLRLWDPATGKVLRTLSGHEGAVVSATFSPDGRTIASGSMDDTLKVWEVASGREVSSIKGSGGVKGGGGTYFSAVAFAPDGRVLASASNNSTLKFWDPADGHELRQLGGNASSVTDVLYAPDGHTLASVSAGKILLWDAAKGREVRRLSGEASAYLYPSLIDTPIAFSPDGHTLVGGSNYVVSVVDADSGKEVHRLFGHKGVVRTVAFSPDGSCFASGSDDNTIKLWDAASGKELRTLSGPSALVAFAPDGRTLLTGNNEEPMKTWDVATGRGLRTFHLPPQADYDFIETVTFSPDGTLLATASTQHLKVWDVASGRELRTLPGNWTWRHAVAFSPDNRLLATGSYLGAITLWDVASGRTLRTLTGHMAYITALTFSADGRTLASGSGDMTQRLWEVATGKARISFISFLDGASLAITPEGYYDASSEKAEECLNVRVGMQVFGIGAYREKFYRPDLVKLALSGGSLSQFAHLDQIKPAPRVDLLEVPAQTSQASLTVKVRLTDTGGGFGAVRLFLNGSAVVQETARAIQVVPAKAAGQVQTYTLQLVMGRNEIKAVAFNADNTMQSNPATAVTRATFTARARPSLHAVIVGIQDFKNPQFKLNYPVADATLFADTLRKSATALFQTLDVTLLTTPAETTREHILQTLSGLRQKVGPEDLFVFYVASHGTVDDGEYYLLTSNVGSASTDKLKADALSQSQLRDMIANIPATKKLIVIDTCNAGALGDTLQGALLTRGLSDVTAMKILVRSMGSTVLSASTSSQQALEGYQGHGLFTFVVAEGLAGKADANHDGFVTTLELAAYVDEQVPLLAERVFRHAQYPVVSPSGQGFPLGKVGGF